MIKHIRKLTPIAFLVSLLLGSITLNSSRIKLLFSGEVPVWRIVVTAAIFAILSYFGAELIRRRLVRDAKEERRNARKIRC